MKLLDLHTHHPAPQPEAIVNLRYQLGEEFIIDPSQRYSVGIHPWDTQGHNTEEAFEGLARIAELPEIVAIGECGVDLARRETPLFMQLLLFRHHVELSEHLAKPLLIHDVKASDIIAGARRDMKPAMNWAIHGFRRKPEVAEMLLRAGCFLSFGAEFNAETLRQTPREMILAETDESELTIEEIIAKMSAAVGEDLTDTIAENTRRFLSTECVISRRAEYQNTTI